jgi:hypothetical protein
LVERDDRRERGVGIGQFQAQDTGNYGAGWNEFAWGDTLGSVTFSAGSHTINATVSEGEGYGVELDALQVG